MGFSLFLLFLFFGLSPELLFVPIYLQRVRLYSYLRYSLTFQQYSPALRVVCFFFCETMAVPTSHIDLEGPFLLSDSCRNKGEIQCVPFRLKPVTASPLSSHTSLSLVSALDLGF